MLSAADLANFRAVYNVALSDTATVSRASSTQPAGKYGSPNMTRTTFTVACDAQPDYRHAGEFGEGGEIHSTSHWVLKFPYGTTIKVSDRITVNGQTFEVMALASPKTNQLVEEVLALLIT